MKKTELVYVTYIRTTEQKLWDAITKPEFARQYSGGGENISDWKKGSNWHHFKGGQKRVEGKVLESTPPRRLVLEWADPANRTDVSQVTFVIEPHEDMVCLKVMHGELDVDSDMAGRVSEGWPLVLSSMKSFLETGKALNVGALQSCNKEAALSQ